MSRAGTGEGSAKFRTFRSYAEHQRRMTKRALASIEQSGVAAALERCRALAERIDSELREKRPEHLDIAALADFQVSLERAASVLNEQLRVGDDSDDYCQQELRDVKRRRAT
jgi:hypothetical protein